MKQGKNMVLYLVLLVVGFILTYFIYAIKTKKVQPLNEPIGEPASNNTLSIVRANNPGALKDTIYNNWVGRVGVTSAGFVEFDNLEHGIRANLLNLRNGYFRKGFDTVRKIITRYSTTDQQPYILFIASNMRVNADQQITESRLSELALHIFRFETGVYTIYLDEINRIRAKYEI